jgi:outer membrane protein assembly factor BamB
MVRVASTLSKDAGKRLALVCVILAGVCCGQDTGSPGDCTQFLRNNMHRFNPYETVLGVNNVGNLKVKWTYATRSPIEYVSPTVANGALYLFSVDMTLYALDARTGGTLWTFPTTNNGGGSVAVANGMVYFSSYGLYAFVVYALDASTGIRKWKFAERNCGLGDPSVLDGVVYVGCDGDKAYALDGRTGTKLWSYHNGKSNFSTSPAIASGVVYFNTRPLGSGSAILYALNAHTGKLIWRYSTSPSGGLSTPAVANGLVYIPPDNNTMYALDAEMVIRCGQIHSATAEATIIRPQSPMAWFMFLARQVSVR